MSKSPMFRTRLFVGVGVSALAGALAFAPERAAAQAFQATPTITTGAAVIDRATPGVDVISADTGTVVIDWVPDEDGVGNALDFLPTGNTGIFQNNIASGVSDFSILNRILPAPNGNIAVIDGTVISRIDDGSGFVPNFAPGGFVAFYSPTGILVGANAVFDVGNLMLTTLDPDVASFGGFTGGSTMNLVGDPGSIAQIIIDPGAQIQASPENSFFIATAANVQIGGSVEVNGSHAYIVGEEVNVTLSNGLFDIVVPVGADAGGLTISGDIGGPSSTGAGDNHIIYAVAKANANPITMLFSGNLGFAPAASAGVVNGEIILAANHDVFGRTVAGADITNGLLASFDRRLATSALDGNIFISGNFSSNTAALTNNFVLVTDPAAFDGDLLLNARSVQLVAGNELDISVAGDLLMSAEDFGAVGSGLVTGLADAFGGNAQIFSFAGSTVSIGGDARLSANARAGAELSGDGVQGNATGGVTQLGADGGIVTVGGSARLESSASGSPEFVGTSGSQTGGFAQIFAVNGGTATYAGPASVDANAFGGNQAFLTVGGPALAGTSEIVTIGTGSSLTFNGQTSASANAFAGEGNDAANPGGFALGGDAFARADDGATLTINGNFSAFADAIGGTNFVGEGGEGNAGSATIAAKGGDETVNGGVTTLARGFGGLGVSGGIGLGGIGGAFATGGSLEVTSFVNANASGTGGAADLLGFGGRGGDGVGGYAAVVATGDATTPASITIGGSPNLNAQGVGGAGGRGDGGTTAPGAGGDGFGGDFDTPNDSGGNAQFTGATLINGGSGAVILADGDFGSVSVAGFSTVESSGFGGAGGTGFDGQAGGAGGTGTGGDSRVGLVLFNPASGGQGGSVNLDNLTTNANGIGGGGGIDADTSQSTGDGGDGNGGESIISVAAGTIIAQSASANANGIGRTGATGGSGTGGRTGVLMNSGGNFTLGEFFANSDGNGGQGTIGAGGVGLGGQAFVGFQDGTGAISGDAFVSAVGRGGASTNADGADGTGGNANISIFNQIAGDGVVGGLATIEASGTGGDALSAGFTGGTGTGGLGFIQSQAGGSVAFNRVRANADGTGGSGAIADGGLGVGGTVEMISDGIGTLLTISDGTQSRLSASGRGGNATGGEGIGGAGVGGTALVSGTNGALIDVDNNSQFFSRFSVTAAASGGLSSVEGGIGGSASGGITTLLVDTGAAVDLPATTLSPNANGGSSNDPGLNIDGGDAIGGTRAVLVTGGATLTGELAGGNATAVGGNASGTGTGGLGEGGTSLLVVDAATFNVVGFSRFYAQSFGGSGRRGGDSIGGTSTAIISNGAVINQLPDANGTARFSFSNAAIGGDGGALGGGSVSIGEINVDISDSTLNNVTFVAFGTASGGNSDSGPGGNAQAGIATVNVSSSIVTGTQFDASAVAFGGGSSTGNGGDAVGGTATINVTNSQINATQLSVFGLASGGDSVDGLGGSAQGGQASLLLTNSAFSGDTSIITADGIGGFSTTGTNGDALGGEASITLAGSSFTTSGDTVVRATAETGSDSATGGSGGDALAGSVALNVLDESTLTAGNLDINSNADAFQNGNAEGGSSVLQIEGGSVDAAAMVLSSLASSGGGSNAFGGSLELSLAPDISGSSASLQAGTAVFENGANGASTSEAGDVSLQTIGSNASFATLSVFSTGTSGGGVTRLFADGGSLAITGFADITASGAIDITALNGALIGGPSVADPTAFILLNSGGTITFNGNNDDAISFGGQFLDATADEININAGSRIGAFGVSFNSIHTENPAIIGGTTDEPGFTLTQAEAERIEAGEFSFFGTELDSSDPNLPDIILRDITAFGSLGDGPSRIEIEVEDTGIVRVEGTVSYIEAAPTDEFEIEAGGRIEIVTPGGIGIFDSNGNPTGSLRLESPNLWVADEALISQLQADPTFEGRNDLLAEAASGSDDPLGYVQAGGIVIEAAGTVLVRNTGTSEEPGGLLVGSGGLSIASDPELSNSESTSVPLDVFTYGRQLNEDGTFVTGEEFYRLVNFNTEESEFLTEYVAGSQFNDCDINDGFCGNGAEEVIEEEAPALTNSVGTEGPVTVQESPPPAEEESNTDFGFDFPGLLDSAPLSETVLLDDPVASGGDSSLYQLSSEEPDEREEDEE